MTALDDLKAYRFALQEARAVEKQMERAGITGAPSSLRAIGNGQRGTNDRTSAAMQRLEGLEALLREKRTTLEEKAIRGERALEMIGYPKARVILRRYYALGDNDRQIARELCLSRTAVQRIRQATERDLDAVQTIP